MRTPAGPAVLVSLVLVLVTLLVVEATAYPSRTGTRTPAPALLAALGPGARPGAGVPAPSSDRGSAPRRAAGVVSVDGQDSDLLVRRASPPADACERTPRRRPPGATRPTPV
ncbi:hypothetical protein GCM10009737_19090 [Nocardioides lentus]|uniref:Secreted protein n=1 Tax=Nocardioides lentus TaxID=338077 RepID=A0ABP5AQP7_9ACTN